jgi:Flp pilus assembly protein TadG
MRVLSGICNSARRFLKDRAGNTAIILALSALPLTLAMGAGVDYARGMTVHANLADALDSAALAVGAASSKPSACSSDGSSSSTTGNGTGNSTPCAPLQQLAQQYFNANFKPDSTADTVGAVNISISNQSVTLTVTDNVPTTFLAAADRMMNSTLLDNIPVHASSTVVWGQTKLWVSVVLDNTGSMCQPDSNPCPTDTNTGIKINALKTATHNLLTTLQNASTTPGDVMAAIVPFAKDVNVGTANVGASWIDWTDWSASMPAGNTPGQTVGPGDSCPFSSTYNDCLTQPGGVLQSDGVSMTTTTTIPSTGTYAGYICPGSISTSSSGQAGHYYNGCFTSVATGTTTQVSSGNSATCHPSGHTYHNCSCTGSGSSKRCNANNYTHTWVLNPTSTWRGCVMDRNQSDDANDTTPGTLFPAENDDSCAVASVLPLPSSIPSSSSDMTTMFTNLSNKVDAMVANGGTNQTIGLAHGMQMQTSGAPYNPPTLPTNTTRYIILLSDGLNTMDRWYGDGASQSSSVDDRMSAACDNAKTQGFIIYTIFVDLNGTQGNSSVLQNCASDGSKYYDLTTSGAIITTFNTIAQQITQLRVSR